MAVSYITNTKNEILVLFPTLQLQLQLQLLVGSLTTLIRQEKSWKGRENEQVQTIPTYAKYDH